jgi:hypothetical protein
VKITKPSLEVLDISNRQEQLGEIMSALDDLFDGCFVSMQDRYISFVGIKHKAKAAVQIGWVTDYYFSFICLLMAATFSSSSHSWRSFV